MATFAFILSAAAPLAGCGDGAGSEPCAAGTFDHDGDDASACVAHSTCPAGQHVTSAGTATADRECAACAAGTYTSSANASACSPHTTCTADEFESAAGTATADRSCTPRSTCAAGQRVSDAGDATQDRSCTACAPSTFSDTVNAASCAPHRDCAAGESVQAEGTATTDRQCSACASGTFSSTTNASACAPHTPCATDYAESSAGTATTDRTCAPLAWTRHIGTSSYEEAIDLVVDSAGNVFVVGDTVGTLPGELTGGGYYDVFVRKYDRFGSLVWSRQFGSSVQERARGVALDSTGNVYVAGQTDGAFGDESNAGNTDAFLVKLNASGEIEWTRFVGTSDYDDAADVVVAPTGGIVLVGQAGSALPDQLAFGNDDVFVRAFDTDGNALATNQLGGTGTELPTSAAVDADGNVYIAGHTSSALDGPGRGFEDAFVMKLDAALDAIWTRVVGSNGYDYGEGVAVDALGQVYVGGSIGGDVGDLSAPDGEEAFVAAFANDGTPLFVRSVGVDGSADYGHGVVALAAGVLLVGYTQAELGPTLVGGGDAFARSYDALGNVLATRQFGTGAEDYSNGAWVDADGRWYLVGRTAGTFPGESSGGGYDGFIAKLSL